MPRLFIAIELPADIQRELVAVRRRLAQTAEGVRWVGEDNIHLTLVFLGETPAEKVEEVRRIMDEAAATGTSLSLALGHLGFFGRPAAPRVIWIGVDGPAALVELQRALADRLRASGYPVEGRPFKAHLTLGRVRDGARNNLRAGDINRVDGRVAAAFVVGEISLIESVIRPEGPIHTVVHRSALGRHL